MVRKLKAASVQNWFADFLHTLADVRRDAAAGGHPADRARTRQPESGEYALSLRFRGACPYAKLGLRPTGSGHKEIFTLFRHSRRHRLVA